MDHAVALVEAYLQINGYFTVAEYPVIEATGERQYSVATDLDILAFRFPGAGRRMAGQGGQGGQEQFAPDPALGIDGTQPDMLIGEVKEGRAELNRAARNPDVLRTVLARFGCCSIERARDTVETLIRKGEATTHNGHRVRLVAFGSNINHPTHGRYYRLPLAHVTAFIRNYLDEHWEALRHAQFKHPALGLLMVLEKARREGGEVPASDLARGARTYPNGNAT
jgi:hypothetical protein